MSALKILVIPGSLRSGSLNAKLAAVLAYELAQSGADVTRISLGDFPLPIYDGDLQAKSGVPQHAVNLKRMIGAHHGVLIVTPEYNSSVPALVKNTIDWVSRVQDPHEVRGQVFHGRAFAISAASGNRLGGTRALAALRLILTACTRHRDPEPARAVIRRAGLRRYGSSEAPGRHRHDARAGAAADRPFPTHDVR
ncbi:NAD(P)H-dependent FMN reductase [Bradyrhizobium elkanii]